MIIVGVVLIVTYWVQSNLLYGNLRRTDNRHAGIAIIQLGTLLLYAYFQEIGIEWEGDRWALALQSLTLAIYGIWSVVGWTYAMKDRRLLSDAITDDEAHNLRIGILAEPITALLTLIAAPFGPAAWTLTWLAMVPLMWFLGRVHRTEVAATAQTPSG